MKNKAFYFPVSIAQGYWQGKESEVIPNQVVIAHQQQVLHEGQEVAFGFWILHGVQ